MTVRNRGVVASDCVFCGIVAGTVPATIVAEDEHTVAFLDIAEVTEGHTLVVPRRHSADLLGAPEEDVAAVMRMAQQVAMQRDRELRPDGITLLQANRERGWQEIFHLHVHVVPRWEEDGLQRPWPLSE